MKSKRLIMLSLILTGILSVNADAGVIRDMFHKRAVENGTVQGSDKMMDLAYGSDKKQRLDVYLPAAPQNAPIIVMVHGGAWKLGDKRSDNVVENKRERWNSKGIIFVSVNYRLLPDADVIKQADDVAAALAYVQKSAASWGGDPQKIVLMGHSAGAHLVSLISSDPTRYSSLKPWLGTVSLDSAAMDVSQIMEKRHYDFYDDAFGSDSAYWEEVSPYYRLIRSARPILMVCSTERRDKPCVQAERYARKAQSLGIRSEIIPQPMSHREINEQLGLESVYTQKVEAFIRSLGMAI